MYCTFEEFFFKLRFRNLYLNRLVDLLRMAAAMVGVVLDRR